MSWSSLRTVASVVSRSGCLARSSSSSCLRRRASSALLTTLMGSVAFHANPRMLDTWALTSSTAFCWSGDRSAPPGGGACPAATAGVVVVVVTSAVAWRSVFWASRTRLIPRPATTRTMAMATRMPIVVFVDGDDDHDDLPGVRGGRSSPSMGANGNAGPRLARARREGEDAQRTHDHQGDGQPVDHGLDRLARTGVADVVVHDPAQPVGPVAEGQDQQQPVEHPPRRVVPALGDEVVVGRGHVVHDVGDGEVDEGEEDERQPRQPHEGPRPRLRAAPAGDLTRRGLERAHRKWPEMKGQRMTTPPGTPASRVTATTACSSRCWLRTASGKMSTATMRRPFRLWNTRANSRPTSNSRSTTLQYSWWTWLYVAGQCSRDP